MTNVTSLSPVVTVLALVLAACDTQSGSVSPRTENLYVSHCARCHEVGAANAPKRGDALAWEKRLRKGDEALVSSVKTGTVAMPPRGDCTECTDDDFKALIEHMAR